LKASDDSNDISRINGAHLKQYLSPLRCIQYCSSIDFIMFADTTTQDGNTSFQDCNSQPHDCKNQPGKLSCLPENFVVNLLLENEVPNVLYNFYKATSCLKTWLCKGSNCSQRQKVKSSTLAFYLENRHTVIWRCYICG